MGEDQIEMFPLTERERFWRRAELLIGYVPRSRAYDPYDQAVREQHNEEDRKQRRRLKLMVIK